MFDFDFLMHTLLRIWLVIFGYMIFSKIILAILQGIRNGCKIAKIKQNVNRKIEEYDNDLKKYFDYEVETNDLSDMQEQIKRE